MKIVYFYQYFGTTKGGWSTRVYEMTRRWVQAGHEVTVVTGLYDRSDLKAKGLITRIEIEGIQVILINIKLSNQHSFAVRLSSFLLYAFVSTYFALRLSFHVCIASSGPITVGLNGLAAKILRRKFFVFEIRDIWPEGAVQMGILRSSALIAVARWFERTCYHFSDLVIACSPSQAEHVQRIAPGKAVLTISNASDNDLSARVADRRLELPEALRGKRFVVYTGTLGAMDGCAQIVEAARVLQEGAHTDIAVLMIGSGNEKVALEQLARDYHLENLHFLGSMPKEQVVLWLQQARAAFYTIKAVPILNTGSPNKVFDAFALGVPLIQNSDGWLWRLVDHEGCGLNVSLGDADAMAAAAARLCSDDTLYARCAANAHRLAQTRFDRARLAQTYLDALTTLGNASRH